MEFLTELLYKSGIQFELNDGFDSCIIYYPNRDNCKLEIYASTDGFGDKTGYIEIDDKRDLNRLTALDAFKFIQKQHMLANGGLNNG